MIREKYVNYTMTKQQIVFTLFTREKTLTFINLNVFI